MRVVLDTNIILSALITPGGIPARLIRTWLDGRYLLLSHARQLDELRDVTRRERIRPLIRPAEAGQADRLATGDKDGLLALERHGATRIVTAAELAAELGLRR